MLNRISHPLSNHLCLITPDLHGRRLDTGESIPTRQTGLVTHTHQLINGLGNTQTGLSFTVTRNIFAGLPSTYPAHTPEGQIVRVQEIQAGFDDYLNDPRTGKVDGKLFRYYYEEDVRNPRNPIYISFASQYSELVRSTPTSLLILQNSIALVSVLKMEELGCLDTMDLEQLTAIAIIHDVEGYRGRLAYVKERLDQTGINIKLIAISQFVRQELEAFAIPKERIFYVPNGIDIQKFDERMSQVKANRLFDKIKKRNRLPENGKMIIVPARRIEHKGHLDVIRAVKLLQDHGNLKDVFVVFTGHNMTVFHSSEYEDKLIKAISEKGLEGVIYLLDALSEEEVYACYSSAYASILASMQPEGFGYANLEAMLAGLPVITSNLGGPLDYMVDKSTGMLVEPNNPYAISAALNAILYDQALYQKLRHRGRKKAEQFSVSRMIDGYLAIING